MKLDIKNVRLDVIDVTTRDSERILISNRWKIEYELFLNANHYLDGTFYWRKKDCIIDEVIEEIRKDFQNIRIE